MRRTLALAFIPTTAAISIVAACASSDGNSGSQPDVPPPQTSAKPAPTTGEPAPSPAPSGGENVSGGPTTSVMPRTGVSPTPNPTPTNPAPNPTTKPANPPPPAASTSLDAGTLPPFDFDAGLPPFLFDAMPPFSVDAMPPLNFDAMPPFSFDAMPPFSFDAMPPFNFDAGGFSIDAAAIKQFSCGNAQCQALSQICQIAPSQQQNAAPSYQCAPVPDMCVNSPSCQCVQTAMGIKACKADNGGNLTVTLPPVPQLPASTLPSLK